MIDEYLVGYQLTPKQLIFKTMIKCKNEKDVCLECPLSNITDMGFDTEKDEAWYDLYCQYNEETYKHHDKLEN